MKRYKPTFKTQVIKEDAEEDKSIKMIKDLIDLDWEKNEDAQHQALAMIKGLVLADTKSADKFLTDLSTYTSKMSIEDYSGKQEEGCKKKPKKKTELKEETVMFNDKESASDAIADIVEYLGHKISVFNPRFFDAVAYGIVSGVESLFEPSYSRSQIEIDDTDAVNEQNIKKVIFKIMGSMKARV